MHLSLQRIIGDNSLHSSIQSAQNSNCIITVCTASYIPSKGYLHCLSSFFLSYVFLLRISLFCQPILLLIIILIICLTILLCRERPLNSDILKYQEEIHRTTSVSIQDDCLQYQVITKIKYYFYCVYIIYNNLIIVNSCN